MDELFDPIVPSSDELAFWEYYRWLEAEIEPTFWTIFRLPPELLGR